MVDTREVLAADPEVAAWVRGLENPGDPAAGQGAAAGAGGTADTDTDPAAGSGSTGVTDAGPAAGSSAAAGPTPGPTSGVATPSPAAPDIPYGTGLADVLLDLGVAPEDVNPVLAARDRLAADGTLSDLLSRCVALVVRDMGIPHGGPGGGPALGPALPALPAELGPAAHWFTLFTLIGALPYTRAYHREHGIPEETSRRSLADVGRHVTLHRRQHGTPGVLHPSWLLRFFRGTLYELGRLQFERALLGGTMGRTLAAEGLAAGPGAPVLLIHIPDFRGPLTPQACDASLAAAGPFFARHFPDEPYAAATCHSWLLDRQLADHLPPTANIVRFQQRFQLSPPDPRPDDRTPIGFVFGDPELPVARLRARTTLERAIVGHLRAGHHWHSGSGWMRLRPE